MLSQSGIRHQPVRRAEGSGKGHLIVGIVDAVVAQAADGNPALPFSPGKILPEMRASMQLAGNEVMKGQDLHPPAKGAKIVWRSFDVCHRVAALGC
jgi:hypothetical protein